MTSFVIVRRWVRGRSLKDLPYGHLLSVTSYLLRFVIKLLLTAPRRCFFCGSFLLFMVRVCHLDLSVHCSLEVTCWEKADLLALLYVMFSRVLVTYPCGLLVQVWYLIVSIPDLCLHPYFGPSWSSRFT